jgi:peroxiredoxin
MATLYGGQSQQRWGDNTLGTGDVMRDFQFSDLSGRVQQTMGSRRGGMVILAFVEAGSPQSTKTLTALQQLADAYAESKKLSVLCLSASSEDETRALVSETGVKFPVGLDYDNYHAMCFGVTDKPTIILADGNGLILRKAIGHKVATLNDMSDRIAKLAGVPAVEVG